MLHVDRRRPHLTEMIEQVTRILRRFQRPYELHPAAWKIILLNVNDQ